MVYNLDAINALYRDYQTAGATLNKAVEATFREVYEDFGFVPVKIDYTSVRPSTFDGLAQINQYYYDEKHKLIFEDCNGNQYPVEQISYHPMNMYLLYQSFAKQIKIK